MWACVEPRPPPSCPAAWIIDLPAGRPSEDLARLKARNASGLRRPGRRKAPTSPKRTPAVRKPYRLGDKTLENHCRTLIPGYDPWRDAGDCYFDHAAGKAACRFFHDKLSHVKGKKARQPFDLAHWQIAVIGNVFGWKKPDGSRRYREVLIYVPRKNGKTTLAAGIVLIGLLEDDEPGAEIYGAGAKYAQACYVFEHARGMVRNCEELNERCQIFKGQAKAIQLTDHPENVDDIGCYRPISSESTEGHGQNTHMGIIDELHLQPDDTLVNSMRTATASEDRRQPLIVYLTTADFDRPSVCNQIHEYASKVRDGLCDPSFLPVIFEATKEEYWTDEAVWHRANPNLGVSVSLDYLRKECQRAQEVPTYENTFKRLHLNIKTGQETVFIPLDQWDECDDAVDEKQLKGRKCFGGLDLASRSDIAAWVLLFPPDKTDGKWRVLPRFFMPTDNAPERERRDRVPYATWGRQGFVTLTPGNVIDYATIENKIIEDGKRFNIVDIGADRWNLEYLRQQLSKIGVDFVEFGQGFQSMSEPTKELVGKLIPSGVLAHGGNPVLRWMVGHAACKEDPAGNVKLDKQKSSEKIDGLVALVMALGRAMVDLTQVSVYKKGRGLIRI
ncbi:hypothetical protein LCGC14_0863880 [marine sediment metagenome]|uniref:Terminase large subunit n=1 Tax=marine sediment metagenome TaxID=412755 RepID=A0A0F9PBK6_9ZZZZ